jgi:EAL domain-containing protein (putative c-di-GMP-specific phosphodiesterase class I)
MHAALLDRVQLVGELRHALARHELTVYYQPTVELADGRIVGTEALLRWHHPRRGELTPDHFVGLAEDNGLITEIGEWVLRETCRQAALWQQWAPEGSLFSMAVNVSARQLTPDLVQAVRSAVDAAGLPPAALMLEITESVLIERTGDMMALMQQLKSFGVRLALDDFGTGYSSLSYLSRFPVDCLKIDRSFVKALGSPSSETELARTILRLSESLGLATIAEGIETPAQYAALRDMGCRYGQGFIFARPLPPHGIDEMLGGRLFAHASPVPMHATYEVPRQSAVRLPR